MEKSPYTVNQVDKLICRSSAQIKEFISTLKVGCQVLYVHPSGIFPQFTRLTITDLNDSSVKAKGCLEGGRTVDEWVSPGNLAHVPNCTTTLEDLNKELEEARKAREAAIDHVGEVLAKIDFMKKNNLETLDEDAFRVFQVIRKLKDSNSTDLEKALSIARIVRGDKCA